MTSSNPGMFFSSQTLKGLMDTSKKKKTSRKPAQTESYQSEMDQLVQSIIKQETGKDNVPKNLLLRKKATTKRNGKPQPRTIVARRMRPNQQRQFNSFAWNNIYNYASAVGLDVIHVEYLENNFGQFRRSTQVANHSLLNGYELVSESPNGLLSAEEAEAALAMADVDVDQFAVSAALHKAQVQPVAPADPSGDQGVISFDRWAHSLVHDIGVHQMASALAERHGILNPRRGALLESASASFLPGSLFDTTGVAMEHSTNDGRPVRHANTVHVLSALDQAEEANVRRSQSQGKPPGQSSEAKQTMMLTLPPLPVQGSQFSGSVSMQALARKRRRKGDTMESTFSNKKLQNVGGFDASFGRQTPRCLREGSTRSMATVSRAGSMSAIDELRKELRLAEEGLSRLDNIVEENIAWVQSNCDIGPNFDMSSRAKSKCKKIAVEKLGDVLGNSAYVRIEAAFRKWRMLFQFTDMIVIVRSYSKIKSIQMFANAFGKIIYRLCQTAISRWFRAVEIMRRFEQEAATVEIQRVVRGRFGKLRVKRRRADIEYNRRQVACIQIQKIVRGRRGGKRFFRIWKEHKHDWAVAYLQHWFKTRLAIKHAKDIVQERRMRRKAAIKIQKVARGRQGRKRFAHVKAKREEQKKKDASSGTLSRFLRRNKETKSERNLLKEKKKEKAEKEKKKNVFQQGFTAMSTAISSKLGGKSTDAPSDNNNDIDKHNFGADIDKAAVKLQAMTRGRLGRQKSKRVVKEKAVKTSEAQPAVHAKDQADKDAAAQKLQAISRGRMARQESERKKNEKKKGGFSFFNRNRDGNETALCETPVVEVAETSASLSDNKMPSSTITPVAASSQDEPTVGPMSREADTITLPKVQLKVEQPTEPKMATTDSPIEISKVAPKEPQKEATKPGPKDTQNAIPNDSHTHAGDAAPAKSENVPSKPTPEKRSIEPKTVAKTDKKLQAAAGDKGQLIKPSESTGPVPELSNISTLKSSSSKKETSSPKISTPSVSTPPKSADKAAAPLSRNSPKDRKSSISGSRGSTREEKRTSSPAAEKPAARTGPRPSSKEKDVPADKETPKKSTTGVEKTKTTIEKATPSKILSNAATVKGNMSNDDSSRANSASKKAIATSGRPPSGAKKEPPKSPAPQPRSGKDALLKDMDTPTIADAELLKDCTIINDSKYEASTAADNNNVYNIQPTEHEMPEIDTVTVDKPAPMVTGPVATLVPDSEPVELVTPIQIVAEVPLVPPVSKALTDEVKKPKPVEKQEPVQVVANTEPIALVAEKPATTAPINAAPEREPQMVPKPVAEEVIPMAEQTPKEMPVETSEAPLEKIQTTNQNVITRPTSSPLTPSGIMNSAKAALSSMGSSIKRAVSPLVKSRPGSRKSSISGGSSGFNDEGSNSIDSSSPGLTAGRLVKQSSRSSVLSIDEKKAVEETKKMIAAQRKAAEYLTWAVVTIQCFARQYLARKTTKKLRALKKKKPKHWKTPGPDSKYFADPKDLSKPRNRKKKPKQAEKAKHKSDDEDDKPTRPNTADQSKELAAAVAEEIRIKMQKDTEIMDERIKRLEALELAILERELKVTEISKMAELQAEQAKEALEHMQAQQKESEEEKKKMHHFLEMAAGPLSQRSDIMATGGMATGGGRRSASSTPRRRGSKSGQMSARERGLPPTALSARGGAGVPVDANHVVYEGDDWVQLWDPDEYSWYWYNRRTQVAQWEYPGTDVNDYSGYESAGGMTDYSTDGGDESGYESDYNAGSTLQGGTPWQEFWDEQAQAKYWYNESTGEASWTRPEGVSSGSRPGSARTAGKLPDDWVSYIDDETDQEYWYNAVTGETSWTPVLLG